MTSGVHLKRVRWVVSDHPGIEDGLGIAPGAPGDCSVDNLYGRILLVIDIEEGLEGLGLATGSPPGEDLEPPRRSRTRGPHPVQPQRQRDDNYKHPLA